jgi:hypothetical protein
MGDSCHNACPGSYDGQTTSDPAITARPTLISGVERALSFSGRGEKTRRPELPPSAPMWVVTASHPPHIDSSTGWPCRQGLEVSDNRIVPARRLERQKRKSVLGEWSLDPPGSARTPDLPVQVAGADSTGDGETPSDRLAGMTLSYYPA